jgi:hypothetical protein
LDLRTRLLAAIDGDMSCRSSPLFRAPGHDAQTRLLMQSSKTGPTFGNNGMTGSMVRWIWNPSALYFPHGLKPSRFFDFGVGQVRRLTLQSLR